MIIKHQLNIKNLNSSSLNFLNFVENIKHHQNVKKNNYKKCRQNLT